MWCRRLWGYILQLKMLKMARGLVRDLFCCVQRRQEATYVTSLHTCTLPNTLASSSPYTERVSVTATNDTSPFNNQESNSVTLDAEVDRGATVLLCETNQREAVSGEHAFPAAASEHSTVKAARVSRAPSERKSLDSRGNVRESTLSNACIDTGATLCDREAKVPALPTNTNTHRVHSAVPGQLAKHSTEMLESLVTSTESAIEGNKTNKNVRHFTPMHGTFSPAEDDSIQGREEHLKAMIAALDRIMDEWIASCQTQQSAHATPAVEGEKDETDLKAALSTVSSERSQTSFATSAVPDRLPSDLSGERDFAHNAENIFVQHGAQVRTRPRDPVAKIETILRRCCESDLSKVLKVIAERIHLVQKLKAEEWIETHICPAYVPTESLSATCCGSADHRARDLPVHEYEEITVNPPASLTEENDYEFVGPLDPTFQKWAQSIGQMS